ncbi:MAG TPA: malto-oligosyltrehalose synthase [Terriglobales bacterium]|nr:malto-oligosyltrehalose synthase [Terriglobales bacterium]
MKTPSIPLSTYRLQFNRSFTFSQAAELVPYLAELGVSHCYASPYLRARPGSMHGYDIIDHHHLNPEIGSPEEYDRFVTALHEHGMGQILDVVPNHMGIMGADNAWWLEVLENGEASTYAQFFDIDWYPLKDELQGKVLVPVLGDQYGTVLDRGELKLTFDMENGGFSIAYFKHRFPVNPREYPRILGRNIDQLREHLASDNQDLLELESLISAFNHLPGREETAPEKQAERLRDKEIHKRRLAALCARSHEISEFLEDNVRELSGTPGDSSSFDDLHALIKAQAYRLAYWRVAADDINYRRFFDVNDLAALRQEDEIVFRQTHELVLNLLRDGKLNGLRIDHPDGLYNPKQYFERLQRASDHSTGQQSSSKTHYVVAEKILTGDEKLPEDWPIHGTTGYNFSNLVNGLFVDPDSERRLNRIYRAFTGRRSTFKELVYECKKLVMDYSLNSELNVLANHLSRIALADRHTCDFTLNGLRDALTEIVACFPVYRTYVTEDSVSASDRMYINEAVECAKEKSSAADPSVYDFIREVLLSTRAEGHPDYYRRSVVHFAMKFQQYTSALMAKGLEDTSFYRYHRLVSLNDVGGDPVRFGIRPEEFHREIARRARSWPHEMVATSTHDSKRSEDVRARINVLSEFPIEWYRHVRKWRELNRGKKTVSDAIEAPTRNDEYLFYQTLVGAWPVGRDAENPPDSFKERMRKYMLKALREAKENTSWANQNSQYEDSVIKFVNAVLDSQEFRDDLLPFHRVISHFGMLNSISQTLIKLTVPGVPDIYQGNELWEFNLVDPDNRRAVDYALRRRTLRQFEEIENRRCEKCDPLFREIASDMHDGRIKLFITWKALTLRKQRPELFQCGEYVPLSIEGDHARHLLAFARKHANGMIVVAVPRLCGELLKGTPTLPLGEQTWGNTSVELPGNSGELRNLFTGESISAGNQKLAAAEIFRSFPVALLSSR